MTKIEKNRDKILRALNDYGKLTIGEVVEMLGISEATARRLFGELERDNLLLRVHGGIRSLLQSSDAAYSFNRELQLHIKEKQLIGRCAANLIEDNDRVFLDSGTTTRSCGTALKERLEREAITNLWMITNSLAYTDILAKVCPVFLTGGLINADKMELYDANTLDTLRNYHFTKAFFGTDAITDNLELMTSDDDTNRLIKTVVANSAKVIILADSSKIGRKSFIISGVLKSSKYTLITDSGAPELFVQKLRSQGVEVIIA